MQKVVRVYSALAHHLILGVRRILRPHPLAPGDPIGPGAVRGIFRPFLYEINGLAAYRQVGADSRLLQLRRIHIHHNLLRPLPEVLPIVAHLPDVVAASYGDDQIGVLKHEIRGALPYCAYPPESKGM